MEPEPQLQPWLYACARVRVGHARATRRGGFGGIPAGSQNQWPEAAPSPISPSQPISAHTSPPRLGVLSAQCYLAIYPRPPPRPDASTHFLTSSSPVGLVLEPPRDRAGEPGRGSWSTFSTHVL